MTAPSLERAHRLALEHRPVREDEPSGRRASSAGRRAGARSSLRLPVDDDGLAGEHRVADLAGEPCGRRRACCGSGSPAGSRSTTQSLGRVEHAEVRRPRRRAIGPPWPAPSSPAMRAGRHDRTRAAPDSDRPLPAGGAQRCRRRAGVASPRDERRRRRPRARSRARSCPGRLVEGLVLALGGVRRVVGRDGVDGAARQRRPARAATSSAVRSGGLTLKTGS